MKRSSQTEKKVFSSANGFEKRPAAKKNCADYGFCAAQIFIALTTAVSLLFGKKLGWNLRENMLICIMSSFFCSVRGLPSMFSGFHSRRF